MSKNCKLPTKTAEKVKISIKKSKNRQTREKSLKTAKNVEKAKKGCKLTK